MADHGGLRARGTRSTRWRLLTSPLVRLAGQRVTWVVVGLAVFLVLYLAPTPPAAVDATGAAHPLTPAGKAALALFGLAVVWWVAEVVPIGVTSIAVGVIQALLLIRPPQVVADGGRVISGAELAFKDFMHPSVWFVFGSVVIGMVLTKTGVTRRMAYGMLLVTGESTALLLGGCVVLTAFLTLFMAHTAVAATVYPLLILIHRMYEEDERPTRFGKGLFIGMAFAANAGSVVTLLGSARAPVAIGFFHAITGQQVTYFGLSWSMAPVAAGVVLLLWATLLLLYRPERSLIPGLSARARDLFSRLGPVSRAEITALLIGLVAIVTINLRDLSPALEPFDATTVVLLATVMFFLLKILDVQDLEQIPWNIILLFGGAMSLGSCLIETGAAEWLAVHCVALLGGLPPVLALLLLLVPVLIVTNLVLNVATVALCLPVILTAAPLLGLGGEVVLYSILAVTGMPFLFLIGAAPNAIAFESKQFTQKEFFRVGSLASLLLLGWMLLMLTVIWPAMGVEVVQ